MVSRSVARPQSPPAMEVGSVRAFAAAAEQRAEKGGEVTLATVPLGDTQLRGQGRPPRVTVRVGRKGEEGGGKEEEVRGAA